MVLGFSQAPSYPWPRCWLRIGISPLLLHSGYPLLLNTWLNLTEPHSLTCVQMFFLFVPTQSHRLIHETCAPAQFVHCAYVSESESFSTDRLVAAACNLHTDTPLFLYIRKYVCIEKYHRESGDVIMSHSHRVRCCCGLWAFICV